MCFACCRGTWGKRAPSEELSEERGEDEEESVSYLNPADGLR
jgi:hypothetical protein